MDIEIKFANSAFKHNISEEEYDKLDEKWTKTTPKVGPNGTGFFAQKKAASARTITVDSFTADYLLTRAIADHKTPAEIISELVHEKISGNVEASI